MARALLFASALIVAATAVRAENACQLVKVAEWPLWKNHYLPVVEGAINGQKVGVLLDTGAFATFVQRSAAAKLALPLAPLTTGYGRIEGIRSYGIEGERRSEGAYINDLRIGNLARKDWLARVTPVELSEDLALVLGYEFFHQLDVELDLPHQMVRLFKPEGCERASLAYWSSDALAVSLDGGPRLQFWVTINGKRLLAELDTGSSHTWLTPEVIAALGLSESAPAMTPAGCFVSRKDGRETWIASLESFAVGNEVIRNPKIGVADLWRNMKTQEVWSNVPRRLQGLADVLLGVDFLRAHRVYVSHSQDKLYFSYTGGHVFSTRSAKPCSELND